MSWISDCYETYQHCLSEVGKQEHGKVPLLPISHTTQLVNIEIALDRDGTFCSARLLAPDEYTTIIPCTESSSARTSNVVPHPLVDKLQYLAADYKAYGGSKKSGWELYRQQLQAWCDSPYGHPLVCSVFSYLKQGHLIRDLVDCHILYTDANGLLPTKWNGPKESKPKIFDTLASGDQTESFVRFQVDGIDLSRDLSVRDSFIQYYESTLQHQDYCTVLGQRMPVSMLSPYKIRNPGDRAKLVSSNDETNFTFLGRFRTAEEALSLGYITTQKAHSALRWLISRQGTSTGDQTVLAWGIHNESIPSITADSYEIACSAGTEEDEPGPEEWDTPVSTQQAFARQFDLAIHGYRHRLNDQSQADVMILDSATPGRLSIRYFHSLQGSRLLQAVEDWHKTFCWKLSYRTQQVPDPTTGRKPKIRHITFYGAPAPKDIAKATYGEKADTRLIQQTIERLVPCISEGKRFPQDLMLSAVRRATNGLSLEPWEYQKTASIACALVRGYYHRNKKEDIPMGVDETLQDRSYLFGRILACAEQIERYAQNQSGTASEKRPTNAERLRVSFVQMPARTTVLLQEKLAPYLDRLRANGVSNLPRYTLMLSLIDRLGKDDFTNRPLQELYLLGYASQMMEFQRQNEEYKDKNPES